MSKSRLRQLENDSHSASELPFDMGNYEDLISGLERIARQKYKNPAGLAAECGVSANLISRWIKRERVPRFDALGPVLDAIGARILMPDEIERIRREIKTEDLLTEKKMDEMSQQELGELFSLIVAHITDGRFQADIRQMNVNPRKPPMQIILDIEPAGEQKMEGDSQMPVKSQAS
jgi:transcriptional regulator with XRE-family HTH domain